MQHTSLNDRQARATKDMCTYNQELLGLAVHSCAGTPIRCPAQSKLATLRKHKLRNNQEVQASEVVKPINEGVLRFLPLNSGMWEGVC